MRGFHVWLPSLTAVMFLIALLCMLWMHKTMGDKVIGNQETMIAIQQELEMNRRAIAVEKKRNDAVDIRGNKADERMNGMDRDRMPAKHE